MRKISLVSALCFVLVSVFSQVIWHDDFSNPSLWRNDSVSYGKVKWRIGSKEPDGMQPFYSETAHNNYAFFNSSESKGPQLAHLYTRNAIKVDTSKKIFLRFSTFFKNCNDSVYVWLSDGKKVSPFRILWNFTKDQQTKNPQMLEYDISYYTKTHDSFFLGFSFGSIKGGGYSMMIDDISIYETSDTNVTVASVFINREVPLHQTKEIEIEAIIKNSGNYDIKNIPVYVTVTGANTYYRESYCIYSKANSYEFLTVGSFSPADTGFNKITVSIEKPNTPIKSSMTLLQHLTRNTFSVNDSSKTYLPWKMDNDTALILLTKFWMNDSSQIHSVKLPLSTDKNAIGKQIYIVLCDSNKNIIDSTDILAIAGKDLGKTHEMVFKNHPLVSTTAFFIGIAFKTPPSKSKIIMCQFNQYYRRYDSYWLSDITCSRHTEFFTSISPVFTVVLGTASPRLGLVTRLPNNDLNLVAWQRPAYRGGISKINVYRKDSSNMFEKIGTRTWGETTEFTDPTVAKSDCYYALSATDTLGHESELTPAHRSIFVTSMKEASLPTLTWNKYEGNKTLSYILYAENNSSDAEQIGVVAGDAKAVPSYQIPEKYRSFKKFWVSASFSDSLTTGGSTPGLSYNKSLSNYTTIDFSPTGIDILRQITVYPIPATNSISVIGLSGAFAYQVIDAAGKCSARGFSQSPTIDCIAQLTPGFYTLVVNQGPLHQRIHFVKR